MALGVDLSQSEKIRQHKIQQQRKRENVWRYRRLGEVKNQMRGHQQEMWYKIGMPRQLMQLRMGIS